MSTIGVVGLGTMGGAIAGRLLEAGHEVHGTNRTAARARPLTERGLIWHESPREVALAVDVVISMVTDDRALDAVTSGLDGIIAGLSAEQIYVDMSSVSPRASVQLAEKVRALDVEMLDAPVSGSVPQVKQGKLAIMVGGEEATFRRVEALLHHLGSSVTHVGTNGTGSLLKLAINISLAVQILAFSEGLLLAERGGIEPALAAKVMSTSSIGSPMLSARVPLLLDLPEDPWFAISVMQKDNRLALVEGLHLSVSLPTATAAASVLQTAMARGYGGRDIAALRAVLAEISETAP